MKQLKKRLQAMIAAVLLLVVALPAAAANTKTSVAQVSATVTIADDVDYTVTSATPFAGEGMLNITNTEHAVVILAAVRPSKAISSWLKYIQVNGEKAVNNRNCQVKLYNRGCIILPYAGGDSFKPLTVYSEANYQGESCNDFGLENDGGFMNTLTEEKLNNRISSFKLKRGYMVTFAMKARGRGYSRCFVAADQDLEIAKLPALLDNSISSYRVFKWYDTGKACLANDTRKNSVDLLGVTSCYSFGLGESRLPDAECVPHHIYEDWPSASACGKVTYSPHLKTNNEPGNSADDRPQTVKQILDNWENLMATGMRLCSPSSHDGSLAHLREFLDSVDARGWRCDIIDLHSYWPEGSFSTWSFDTQWASRYGRPIWVSEWVWGASWNQNGAFASGVTEAQNKEAIQRICANMNNWDCIERYYYWNSERDPSKILRNDGSTLTPAGQYYASINSGVGYKNYKNYVPKTPRQLDPSDLTVEYDKNTHVATLSWKDYNGEMNASMTIERRPNVSSIWRTIATVTLEDGEATYTYEDKEAVSGCQYRILVVDANNAKRYTPIVMAASNDVEVGDKITVDGVTKYMGGNLFVNGSFEMDAYGWTNGEGAMLAAPYFQVVPVGGNDGGSYLQAYGNGDSKAPSAVYMSIDIKDSTNYYVSLASSKVASSTTNRFGISKQGNISMKNILYVENATANWITQYATFFSGSYKQARLMLYSLGAQAQFDQFVLCQLFSTKDSAIADGIAKAMQKIEAFKAFNTKYATLNEELAQVAAKVTEKPTAEDLKTVESAISQALTAYRDKQKAEAGVLDYGRKLAALKLYGHQELAEAVTQLEQASTAAAIIDSYNQLQNLQDTYLPYTTVTGKVAEPQFAKTTGWTTKSGTYTGGDQRIATKDGVTCWNAWWSGLDASNTTDTMAVEQVVTNLPHGLYALECKAATEHFCLSDQHGFITAEGQTENTQALSFDLLDLNVPADSRWETLSSVPVYVEQGASVTIGFMGSKHGSMSEAWLPVGQPNGKNDKREGWWCATDFALRYVPLYKLTAVPGQVGLVCLPRNARPSEGMKLYEIAGVNSDYTQICLQEVTEIEAGVPCFFTTTATEALFYEYGDAVTSPSREEISNLRGYFVTSGRVPTNYYYVKDGAFEKVTGDRPSIGNYTGIMRPFDDKNAKGIPVLEAWTGKTMPINGVTDEEKAANASGIALPTVARQMANGLYTLDGRYLSSDKGLLRPGLYIRVADGKAYKTVIQ